MASSSSSSIIASPAADASNYDVFLSFRGEDTRHSFTDHLYKALKRAGINTFRDNEEIDRGEELKPEIERAIQSSRASIVVLSHTYATSAWCLDELVLILQQRKECNHFVLPVFYHVDPSDVRKQNQNFEIEVKASSRWTDQNVNLWKKALTEVADLAGMVLSGHETKFLKEIVDTIYNKLDGKEVHLPPNLTGMATRYEEITSWLNRSNVELLAICGMGGSGKTTLAKYIYDSNRKLFESLSFVENISRRCKESHDLLVLQEQLLKDILGGKKRKIPSISQGTCKIEEALQTKRALIVLDDIADRSQLVALLGTGKINVESKIIITTTREDTYNWFKFTCWRCQDYNIKLLNDDESLELLSRHAFGSKAPMEGFEELALQAVHYCEGNPLALEVLSSSLSNDNTILYWKSRLNLLDKDFNSRIQSVLLTSYESLPSILEKELFLHVACFFVGKDKDYVVKILEHDYCALSGIKILSNRCLLSVSPNRKLMMHRLLQEMGKNIVRQESLKFPAKRSRVWLSSDSYKILCKGEGSETMEGLALDIQLLREDAFKSLGLQTDALKKMDKLKLLQLNFVCLNGSYENFSEDLRWLCWPGFHLSTIRSDLFMGNLVALDLSYSKLEIFDPPMVLQSLQILNLKDAYNLIEIRSMSRIPHLETLILWNCHSLVHVCESIGGLTSLELLNMTGCKNLLVDLEASTSGGRVAEKSALTFPHSLHRLFLKDCDLECTNYLSLSFSVQLSLQYLNLGNSLFEFLPRYDHLKNLRVLDLSLCSRLKWIHCLPSTLEVLYIYYCKSLEKISFQSHRFTLQEFGYEGCINLSEVEGFIKLIHVAKLEESDLGHMKWLKEYQNHEVCLVGDDELTKGRNPFVQMLYEFDIMSTSLPDINDLNMKPTYVSPSLSMSFDVPLSPKNRKLKGLDVTFRYRISGDDEMAWFCKISTTNGIDLMYNPKVFGKPESGKVGIWLSYWPIGNTLNTGDKVSVSIAVMSGLEVQDCGLTLVYADEKVAEETLENNMRWIETLGGDLSGFQLSTGAYYLCRRDLFELMEVRRLTRDWFRILVGDTIDVTEVRGWRKTGRPKQMNPSYTELKIVRCFVHGPEMDEIYKIPQMAKSSFLDKPLESTSSNLGETIYSAKSSKRRDTIMEDEIHKIPEMEKSFFVYKPLESTSRYLGETVYSATSCKPRDTVMQDENYTIPEMEKSSFVDKPLHSTSTDLGERIYSATSSKRRDIIMQDDIYKIPDIGKSSFVDKPLESTSSDLGETIYSATSSKLTYTRLQKFTNETRRILVDLDNYIVPEDEHNEEDEELGDVKERINSIEKRIMIWEHDESMIWDSDPEEAKEYLKTVDEARWLSESLESLNLTKDVNALLRKVNALLQTSMARIEEEFHHILLHNCQNVDHKHLSFRSSEDDAVDDSVQRDSISRGAEVSIVNLVNPMVIPDLKWIVTSMVDSNYGRECSQAFIGVRKDMLDECLVNLEFHKLSIENVTRMEWDLLNTEITKWTKAIKIFIRVYLASEKFLCEQIFGQSLQGESISAICFTESSKASVLQLLNFAEAIATGPHQPDKFLRILEMFDVLSDLMADIENLYCDENGFYLRMEWHDVLTRVGDYVKVMFIKFEDQVRTNPSKTVFPGGGIQHLTRYVMNYIKILTDFGDSLNLCLKDHRVGDNQDSSSSPHTSPGHEDDSVDGNSSASPMALHFRLVISLLECNLEENSKLYKYEALGHLFMMNNINYIAEKVNNSEMRNVLGDDWIQNWNWKFQQYMMNYERATWSSILNLLQEDGLDSSGSSNSISKTMLWERLQAFYAAFEDIYKNQTGWSIPNSQLRDDLRISISVKVISAYRTFIGRHAHTISGKYIKYTADELEHYFLDLFEGAPRSLQSFHRKWRH